jgi:hypothetical protein
MALIFLSQQVKFSLLLEKNLFPPFLCNLKLITIALPISFTLKHILFAREGYFEPHGICSLFKGKQSTCQVLNMAAF